MGALIAAQPLPASARELRISLPSPEHPRVPAMRTAQKVSAEPALLELVHLLARQAAREWLRHQPELAGQSKFSSLELSNEVPEVAAGSEPKNRGGDYVR